METIEQLQQTTISQLEQLSVKQLIQTLHFIQSLLKKTVIPSLTLPDSPSGRLENLLACSGIWEFAPGELDDILHDIETSRLMELDVENDLVFA